MAIQFVGARYVPKFYDKNNSEWQPDNYEPMTVVLYKNSSYTSKVPVPNNVGNPVDNPEYWAHTGDYNGQWNSIINYLDNSLPYVTPEQYGAIGDGVTDDTKALQKAINSGKIVVGSNTYVTHELTITNKHIINFQKATLKGLDPYVLTIVGDYNVVNIGRTYGGIRIADLSQKASPWSNILNCHEDISADTVPAISITALNKRGCQYNQIYLNGASIRSNSTSCIYVHTEGSGNWIGEIYINGGKLETGEHAIYADCENTGQISNLSFSHVGIEHQLPNYWNASAVYCKNVSGLLFEYCRSAEHPADNYTLYELIDNLGGCIYTQDLIELPAIKGNSKRFTVDGPISNEYNGAAVFNRVSLDMPRKIFEYRIYQNTDNLVNRTAHFNTNSSPTDITVNYLAGLCGKNSTIELDPDNIPRGAVWCGYVNSEDEIPAIKINDNIIHPTNSAWKLPGWAGFMIWNGSRILTFNFDNPHGI